MVQSCDLAPILHLRKQNFFHLVLGMECDRRQDVT